MKLLIEISNAQIVYQVSIGESKFTARGRAGPTSSTGIPASSFAVVGVAALVTVDGGRCSKVSLVVGGAAVNPVRVQAAEAALTGQAPNEANLAAAAAKVAAAIPKPLSDLYASGEYCVHLAGVLARRALVQAAERAARSS